MFHLSSRLRIVNHYLTNGEKILEQTSGKQICVGCVPLYCQGDSQKQSFQERKKRETKVTKLYNLKW